MTPLKRSTLIALTLLLEPRPLVVKRKDGSLNIVPYSVTYQGTPLQIILEANAQFYR